MGARKQLRRVGRATALGVAAVVAGCSGGGDAPVTGHVGFTDRCYIVGEGAEFAIVTVERTDASTAPASVGYSTIEDTALSGLDYTDVSGTLEWEEGDTSLKFIFVPISSDVLDETNQSHNEERLTVRLAFSSSTLVSGNRDTQLAIMDDDGANRGAIMLADPVNHLDASGCHVAGSIVSFTHGALEITEGDPPAWIALELKPETRSGIAFGAPLVQLRALGGTAEQGSDYGEFNRAYEWGPDEEGIRRDPLVIIDDAVPEATEWFSVVAQRVTGATLVGEHAGFTVQILDND